MIFINYVTMMAWFWDKSLARPHGRSQPLPINDATPRRRTMYTQKTHSAYSYLITTCIYKFTVAEPSSRPPIRWNHPAEPDTPGEESNRTQSHPSDRPEERQSRQRSERKAASLREPRTRAFFPKAPVQFVIC